MFCGLRDKLTREATMIPVLVALVVAVISDLRSRRIPNWLVLPLLTGGIAASCWLRGWTGLLYSIEGVALGLVIFLIPFLLGGMGAGDVKLCAAIGAWIWPQQLLIAVIVTGLAGGIIAVFAALCGGYLREVLRNTSEIVLFWDKKSRQADKRIPQANGVRRTIPYSPAIAIGTALSFLATIR